MEKISKNSQPQTDTGFLENTVPEFHLYQDWVFHYVFSQNTAETNRALIAVLNIVLEREEDPITEIEILNPVNYRDTLDGKDTTLDIKAAARSGEIIDVEMQNGRFLNYEHRSLFYGGRLVNSSLENGEEYDKMKKSIVISFMNGTIFKELSSVHTVFQLRERNCGRLLSDRLEIHFIELGKVAGKAAAELSTPVEKLAGYFKYAGEKSKEGYLHSLIQTGGEPLQMIEKVFETITEDDRIEEMYWRKCVYDHDQATLLSDAREQGKNCGRTEGEARFARLTKALISAGRIDDLKKCTEDPDFREELYREILL